MRLLNQSPDADLREQLSREERSGARDRDTADAAVLHVFRRRPGDEEDERLLARQRRHRRDGEVEVRCDARDAHRDVVPARRARRDDAEARRERRVAGEVDDARFDFEQAEGQRDAETGKLDPSLGLGVEPGAADAEIRAATIEAGLRRIRPALMTTVTTFIGLAPVLTATGRGADLARGMAMPLVGGMIFDLIGLFIVPVLYCGYMETRSRLGLPDRPETTDVGAAMSSQSNRELEPST